MRQSITSLLVVAALFAPASGSAQSRRAMRIDDLITAVRVGDPQLSPDGARVLFTRTTTDATSGRRNADIWSVPADGATPATLFIGGERSENTARFSADGQRIAFISSRSGTRTAARITPSFGAP